MKYHYTGRFAPNRLHAELQEAIPACQPTGSKSADGMLEARDALEWVPHPDDPRLAAEIWYTAPDEVPETEIAAVVAAHDPTPPPAPPDPDAELLAAIAQAQAQAAAATTVAGMRGAFDALCNALAGKLRPGRVAGRAV